ncbi:MAG: Gfo/Idh/MocA family protein, partial [Gemmataceae bacterium]
MKYLLVGAGRIAQSYLHAFAADPQFTLVGIVETVPAVRDKLIAELGVPVVPTIDEFLPEMAFDAAVVCTPPATHRAFTQQLCAAGKHVLCEKPLATNPADVRVMIAAAEASGTTLAMPTKFRMSPDIQQAQALLRNGAIQSLAIEFASLADMSGRWNSDPDQSGGGVIYDNAPHALDLIEFLAGPIENVQVQTSASTLANRMDTTTVFTVQTARVAEAVVTLTWDRPSATPNYITAKNSAGSLSIGWKESLW